MSSSKLWGLALATLLVTAPAMANHPVLLEGGNAADQDTTSSTIMPGTGGDYDGDGLIGLGEDLDGDGIFGTLNGALGATGLPRAANFNGQVIIVTSGRFNETVVVPANQKGTVIIEAAPGVHASIDAVVQGTPGNAARQNGAGIVILTNNPTRNSNVILRNLVIRNFNVGVLVGGNARVTMENCRFDSNVAYGVQMTEASWLTMNDCTVNGSGIRVTGAGAADPAPGTGIIFQGSANGRIHSSTVSGNQGFGIFNDTKNKIDVTDSVIFDNGPDGQANTGGKKIKEKN